MFGLKTKIGGKFEFKYMVKSTLSLKIWPINTPLLLGAYSKSCMAFSLVTLKMTFDLLFKVLCKNSCFLVNFISFYNGIGHIKTIISPVGAMHFVGQLKASSFKTEPSNSSYLGAYIIVFAYIQYLIINTCRA
jgi:hypothetical protein